VYHDTTTHPGIHFRAPVLMIWAQTELGSGPALSFPGAGLSCPPQQCPVLRTQLSGTHASTLGFLVEFRVQSLRAVGAASNRCGPSPNLQIKPPIHAFITEARQKHYTKLFIENDAIFLMRESPLLLSIICVKVLCICLCVSTIITRFDHHQTSNSRASAQ